MTMDKYFLEWHKKRSSQIFINFKNKDLYNIEYEFLQYNKENENYSLYGYYLYGFKIFHYSGVFYIVKFEEKTSENYILTFKNIDEVNGFIKTLYKVFYKVITC